MQLNTQNTVKSDNHHELKKELEEKTEEMLCMENLFQTLIYKERMCNDELQDARKEAIRVQFVYSNFWALLRINVKDCKCV